MFGCCWLIEDVGVFKVGWVELVDVRDLGLMVELL